MHASFMKNTYTAENLLIGQKWILYQNLKFSRGVSALCLREPISWRAWYITIKKSLTELINSPNSTSAERAYKCQPANPAP